MDIAAMVTCICACAFQYAIKIFVNKISLMNKYMSNLHRGNVHVHANTITHTLPFTSIIYINHFIYTKWTCERRYGQYQTDLLMYEVQMHNYIEAD